MKTGVPRLAQTARGPVEYVDQGTGPAMLCLHGAMGGYDQSLALGLAIADPSCQFIAVSRPGYLGTPLSAGQSPEAQADLYAALLDHLGIENVVAAAISGGGPSAMQFAIRHPRRCRRLILCSTVGGPTTHKIPLAFHVFTALAKFDFVARRLQAKTAANLKASAARSIAFPDLLEKTMADAETMDLFKVVLLGSFERMGERIAGTRNDIRLCKEFASEYQNIRVPTLVVHGTHDPFVPFAAHGKLLCEGIPSAQLCLGERGEHTTIFTHRAQVRAAVREFLRE